MSTAAADAVVERLVRFGRLLRDDGVEVGPGRVQDALRGLDHVDLANRAEVYHALRCTMVSHHDDLAPFDAAFAAFFEALPGDGEADTDSPQAVEATPAGVAADLANDDMDEEREAGVAAYSATELLNERDFADMTTDELLACRRLMTDLARHQPLRRSRRLRPDPVGRVLDHRGTLRAAMRTQGLPMERAWRRPKLVPRKLVFLCDVSGSMEAYARAMVLFEQAMTQAGRRVEAFAFGTRLTRLTPHLQGRDPAAALAVAGQAMPDWGGGTRIGRSLAAYNREYGRRGLTRGAVVVIMSDGWERGELDALDREMARIHRAAHQVIWVNPLKGHAGFEPLAGGMRTALRHTDVFLEGHDMAAITSLSRVLAPAN